MGYGIWGERRAQSKASSIFGGGCQWSMVRLLSPLSGGPSAFSTLRSPLCALRFALCALRFALVQNQCRTPFSARHRTVDTAALGPFSSHIQTRLVHMVPR